MKSRTGFLAALAIVLAAAVAMASPRPRALYRIELRSGGEVLAKDRPHHRGSVILFHRHSNGMLTSLPEEDVVGILSMTAEVKAQGLQPGDVVYIGPTGAGALPPEPAPAAAASTMASRPYNAQPQGDAPYGYGGGPSVPPNQVTVSPGVFSPATPAAPGDLARAVSAAPPTAESPIGSDGFPVSVSGSAPPIGADGAPILAPPGVSGSTPLVIGPDGTPVLAPPGFPGSAAPPIGPNGTPVLAPAGAPGSTAPPVGSNGFPAPAPAGRK